MKRQTMLAVAALAMATVLTAQVSDAWARARGGGFRGSRSYSAPARPSTPASPTDPATSRSLSQQTPPAAPGMQRPGMFGGFMGGLAGFALGGLLGSLLFGGLGRGFGIGLMDLLLIGAGIFLLMQFMRRRRAAAEPATAGSDASRYETANTGAGGTAVLEMPAAASASSDVDAGVAHIRQMDPGFAPRVAEDWVRAQYADVQAAVGMRDVSIVRDRLAPEMYGVLLTQCEDLRRAHRRSHVEKLDLQRVQLSEAWQERGQDFVTVYVEVTMLDYVTDEATGQVVEGSKTDPVRVEEFWTLTRPVGPNAWKLAAIQSA
jgi:predicted lipid-binding transport protein (Tim44 family)